LTTLHQVAVPRFTAVRRQARLRRLRAWLRPSIEHRFRLLSLEATIEALGRRAEFELGCREVPLSRIGGTLARAEDFDRQFAPMRADLRDRWGRLAGLTASGLQLPPVTLVQVGELYFVVDGHHRVSVARALGRVTVDGCVRRICTALAACHCLTVADLPAKTAERERLALLGEVVGEEGC
jgi:uncharacterized ParB-like nuclease family protein